MQTVPDKLLRVGTRIQSELTRRPEVEKMRRNSHITYGLSMGLLYTSEERDKIMGNGESGAGADALEVVPEVMGFEHDEALTLGWAASG